MRKDLLGISISLFVLVISACERVENLDDLESRLSLLENADLQKDSLYLKSISFLSDNNPRLLVDNLYGEIFWRQRGNMLVSAYYG